MPNINNIQSNQQRITQPLQTTEGETSTVSRQRGERSPTLPDLLKNGSTPTVTPVVTGRSDSSSTDTTKSITALDSAIEILESDTATPKEKLDALLSLIGDSNDIARLMIELASMGRENALSQRLQAREQARDNLELQAGEMRQAAEKQISAALTQMIVSIVVAVVAVVTAGISVRQAGQSASKSIQSTTEASKASTIGVQAKQATGDTAVNLTKTAGNYNVDSTTLAASADKINKTSAAFSAGTQGITQAGNAAAGYAAALDNASATIDQAEGQEYAAASTVEQSNADIAKKVMEDFEELVKSAIAFLKAMQAAEVDLMANMTRV